eukprot:CAMPEP_0175156494 /NCGR_PEP_ID=MMETSP0087-20121206/21630_1 /TAXON_ID=136419 /ORGANISM="Unknown Unknown, Strain D1" /LENGTH=185 /DNA_ID=CAMNT_0016443903 /DNA_START=11 /DNA_END=568 /DNA_ORIENTATION=+
MSDPEPQYKTVHQLKQALNAEKEALLNWKHIPCDQLNAAQKMQRELQTVINCVTHPYQSSNHPSSLSIAGYDAPEPHPTLTHRQIPEAEIRDHIQEFVAQAKLVETRLKQIKKEEEQTLQSSRTELLKQDIAALKAELVEKDALMEKYRNQAAGWEQTFAALCQSNKEYFLSASGPEKAEDARSR